MLYGLLLVPVLYGGLAAYLARRSNRSPAAWSAAGLVAGPLVVPVLMTRVGDRPPLVRPAIMLASVLALCSIGAALGALGAVRRDSRPVRVERRHGRQVVTEDEGPTGFAMLMIGQGLVVGVLAGFGAAVGLAVAPPLALGIDRFARR
jgi:hypothetical protein